MPDDLNDLLERTTIEVPASLSERVGETLSDEERGRRPKEHRSPQPAPVWVAAALMVLVVGGVLFVAAGGRPILETAATEPQPAAAITSSPTEPLTPSLTPSLTVAPVVTADYPLTALRITRARVEGANAGYILLDGVRIYGRDAGEMLPFSVQAHQGRGFVAGDAGISADANIIAYWGFTDNTAGDCDEGTMCGSLFIHERSTATAERIPFGVPLGSPGVTQSVVVTPDGRFVGFASQGAVRDGAFVHDRERGTTTRVAAGGLALGLSSDGRYAAVVTTNELIEEDINPEADVYRIDRRTGAIELLSRSVDGVSGAMPGSAQVDISADGRLVAFYSTAGGLVEVDFTPCTLDDGGVSPVCQHIYLYEGGEVTLISATAEGVPGSGISQTPLISPQGRYIAYTTAAENLGQGFTCQPEARCGAAALYDRQTGQTRLISTTWEGHAVALISSEAWAGPGELIISASAPLLPGISEGDVSNIIYIVDAAALFEER
jgi:hypothetical protein